jgi:ribonuclease HII
VAKVARHRLMARLGERYSGYGFGPTPEHRLSVKAGCFAEFAARGEVAAKRISQSLA